jgi:hypothetical protein
MCSKQCGFIDVVCIGKGPARVVGWEAERVEVLVGCDDGVVIVIVVESRGGKVGFDDLTSDIDRMVFL